MTNQVAVIDNTQPGTRWEFDTEVTDAFDNMLVRSIPQYPVMRQACFELACRYRKPKTDIVDLGCSRGEAMAPLVDKFGATNHFIGVEVSQPMLAAARERFEGFINCHVVEIVEADLRTHYPGARASVTMCVLALQFIPINYRQQILRRICESTVEGGALIFVEKILGDTAHLDDLMVDIYHNLKTENGYSQEAIERKRLSLEGVLVPVTAHWNEEMLHKAGFAQVDCFWRWMNFAGWIAVK
ncbi:MAG: methyltransferase domain-containing protein [Anaerolineae bacterium]|nr:methyltransferase domain-containing protein [Anaerolineae bacterium]